MPPIRDPLVLAYQGFLIHFTALTFLCERAAFGLPVLASLRLTLAHGHSEWSPHAFAIYVAFLAARGGCHDEAREFCELAIVLLRRHGNPATQTRARLALASSVFHFWPLARAIDFAEATITHGLPCGDFVFVSYAANLSASHRLCRGTPLGDLLRECLRLGGVLDRTGEAISRRIFAATRALALALRGDPRPLRALVREDALAPRDPISGSAILWARLTIATFERDRATALEIARRAAPPIAAAEGNFFHFDVITYACLALCDAAADETDEGLALALFAELAILVDRLADLAAACPANFAHKLALVRAEEARARGDAMAAIASYEAAIAGAREGGFIHEEALACERAADFYLALDRPEIAVVYLTEARARYVRWGALPKAQAIDARRSALAALRGRIPRGLRTA